MGFVISFGEVKSDIFDGGYVREEGVVLED